MKDARIIVDASVIPEKLEVLEQYNPAESSFSCDWSKTQAHSIYRRSLIHCKAVFAVVSNPSYGFRPEYVTLGSQLLALMKPYIDEKGKITLLEDRKVMSFVCYQLERYALRCVAYNPGAPRNKLADMNLPFWVGQRPPKKPLQTAPTATVAPAKQEKQAQPASEPSMKDVLTAIQALAAEVQELRSDVDALKAAKTKRSRASKKTEAPASTEAAADPKAQ